MRPYGTPQQLEKRRRQAIALLKKGHSYRSVATKLESSLSSVVRWFQAYRRKGREGLRSRPTPGRPPRLTKAQKEKLLRLLVKGAPAEGYATDRKSGIKVQRDTVGGDRTITLDGSTQGTLTNSGAFVTVDGCN